MKSICILLTDHQSFNEIILIKTKKILKKSKIKKIFFIGDIHKFNKIYKLLRSHEKFDFINFKNKNPKKYLNLITNKAINLVYKKKINAIINLPLNKKKYLNKKFSGFTEFFSKKIGNSENENMLLFNKFFSVCPITTHVKIKDVKKKITKKKIINTVININNFYLKVIKKKIKLKILGLNPHAGKDFGYDTEEKKILIPSISYLKNNKKIKIIGPLSPDTAFLNYKDSVFIGMYHDQVLTPFKTINKFDGINITIGCKILRISPDHGVGNFKDKYKIKNINTLSFENCIKFCENYI